MQFQDTAQSAEALQTHSRLETDFHGAAMIDSSGNEVPITEAMVQDALDCLGRINGEFTLQWL